MRLLYVENFRGFEKQYIPLEDVNFLVGENSTGKTSILALISLLSSLSFWHQQDFNTDDYQFGNYSDIASVDSKNGKFFRIGHIVRPEELPTEGKDFALVFMMEFYEKDGIPSISKYCYVNETNSIQIFFNMKDANKKDITYKVSSFQYSDNPCEAVKAVFESWFQSETSPESLKTMKLPFESYQNIPLFIIASFVEKEAMLIEKGKSTTSGLINMPGFAYNFAWIAPIRSKPKRTYDQIRISFSPEGDHTPYLIKRLLKGRDSKKFRSYIQEYGKQSGLLDDIGIKMFGKSKTSPFELNILLDDKTLNISNVGYGVSQVLPILVEIFARPEKSWFAIQQSEIHLHPRAEAALGDIFFKVATEEKKHFLIETHSDFIIDRFRKNFEKTDKKERDNFTSQVIFFERKGGFNMAHRIEIKPDGSYSGEKLDSFRDFFINEKLSLLGIR